MIKPSRAAVWASKLIIQTGCTELHTRALKVFDGRARSIFLEKNFYSLFHVIRFGVYVKSNFCRFYLRYGIDAVKTEIVAVNLRPSNPERM